MSQFMDSLAEGIIMANHSKATKKSTHLENYQFPNFFECDVTVSEYQFIQNVPIAGVINGYHSSIN